MHDVRMKDQCFEVVCAMIALGATFKIHAGALGAETWTYELQDEDARTACRRLLASADRHRRGFNSAFISALRVVMDQQRDRVA